MKTYGKNSWRRNRKWLNRRVKYRLQRRELVAAMGGRCFRCRYKWRLEFHHLTERTWVCRQLNRLQRLRKYCEEWLAGVLVLACQKCNKKIGKPLDAPIDGSVPEEDVIPT